MPIGTAALAATIETFKKISVRSKIKETNFSLTINELMCKTLGGRTDGTMTESDFILGVLAEFDLVDTHMIDVIREEFMGVVQHDREATIKKEIDAKVVFHHLRTQGRIGDKLKAAGGRRASMVDKAKFLMLGGEGVAMPRVDMSADDRGFSEWYAKYWAVDVAKGAQKPDAAETMLNSFEKLTGVDLDGDGDVGEQSTGPGYNKIVDLEA